MANLWDIFFMSQSYGFLGERRGGSDTFSIAYIAIFGHFGCFVKFCFFPFFVTKNQKCPKRSITPENKGEGGSNPVRKNSIKKQHFLTRRLPLAT